MLVYQLNEYRNSISYLFFKNKRKKILYKLYGGTEWQTIDYVLLNINKHNAFYHNHQREMIWGLFLNNMFSKH